MENEHIDDHSGSAARTDEETPLLRDSTGDDASSTPNNPSAEPATVFTTQKVASIALIIGTVVIVEAATILQDVPIYQILEEIICRQIELSGDGGLDTWDCSSNEDVQAELAFLRGWQLTLELLPGIIMAVPYGYVADHYGRRFMLTVSMVGILLTSLFYLFVCWRSDIFPVRLTWAASIFTLIGGGPVILNGIVFAMLSDLSPEALRSTVFFYFGAAVLASELVFSAIASILMVEISVWAPIKLSLVLFVPVLPLCFIIPETLLQPDKDDSEPEAEASYSIPDHEGDDGDDANEPEAESGTVSPTPPKTIWTTLCQAFTDLIASTVFLFNRAENNRVAPLLATLLTTTLGRHAQDILLQFTRSRFEWSWGQAGYLVSLKALILLVLLLILLPSISTSYALSHWWPRVTGVRTSRQRDLWLARASCVIFIVGSLIIGLSLNAKIMITGLVIYCLGSGYNLVLRSLLAALVEPAHRGTLFNAAGILESAGAVISGPLLAASYRAGLRLGGLWTGLPFFVAVALFGTALFVLATARLPST